MKSYPICPHITDRPCLVIGGGLIAEQTVRSLVAGDTRDAVEQLLSDTVGRDVSLGTLGVERS